MAGLALTLAGAWAGWQLTGPGPATAGNAGLSVGAYGPLVIEFPAEVDRQSAVARISFDPLQVGTFSWQGNQLSFAPLEPLISGASYQVSVAPGVRAADGRTIRQAASWKVTVREAGVAYLHPLQGPELWVKLPGDEPRQVSFTDGRVFDFTVGRSGEEIIYSVINDQGGTALWIMNRSGEDVRELLDCAADWCANPAISPDGRQVAYARRLAGVNPGSAPGIPRVWMLDRASGITRQLFANPNIIGSEPQFSPDGRWLVFYDGIEVGLRLVELASNQDFLLPSNLGMTAGWSPDGLDLFFNRVVEDEATGNSTLYRYAISTQQISKVIENAEVSMDYGPASVHPNGELIALGVRDLSGNPARQLILFNRDGSQVKVLTTDVSLNVAAYQWSADGQAILFQGLQLGSSDARPSIDLLDVNSGAITLVSEQATQPRWIP
ncbi:MAG: PD40 domain-containing protein [Anaerolineae bacterium]|nr:PD40 domain-containing protein [Anaerolineae bacterium]